MIIGKAKKLMIDYCLDRSDIDLVGVYKEKFSSLIDFPSFSLLWNKLSEILSYPRAGLMRPEDSLEKLMSMNNAKCFFDFDEFEDIYEIFQAINIDYVIDAMDVALSEKREFSTVGDLLYFICMFYYERKF
jgi:hypothetical protein